MKNKQPRKARRNYRKSTKSIKSAKRIQMSAIQQMPDAAISFSRSIEGTSAYVFISFARGDKFMREIVRVSNHPSSKIAKATKQFSENCKPVDWQGWLAKKVEMYKEMGGRVPQEYKVDDGRTDNAES